MPTFPSSPERSPSGGFSFVHNLLIPSLVLMGAIWLFFTLLRISGDLFGGLLLVAALIFALSLFRGGRSILLSLVTKIVTFGERISPFK